MITGNPVTITVYCDDCGRGLTVKVRDIDTIKDTTCDSCQSHGRWHSAGQPNGRFPYVLTFNDKRFLRSLRIEQDE